MVALIEQLQTQKKVTCNSKTAHEVAVPHEVENLGKTHHEELPKTPAKMSLDN